MPLRSLPVHEVKASLFRVLGHPARVRILELLRDGERSVGALQAELGLDSGGTSQHLAALRRIGLVESRREGTSVYYRVDDERVFDLLEAARAIIARQLAEQQSLLQRARDGVTGAALARRGLRSLAAGCCVGFAARCFGPGSWLQAAGALRARRSPGSGCSAAAATARRRVHERLRSALRRRRAERALPRARSA